MAHIAADFVKETSTTTGVGNLTLAGAVSGYRAFSAVCANSDTFFYTVKNPGTSEFETGLGTYVSATPAIARTTVITSSNANAAVSFSAGTKDVFICTLASLMSWGEITTTPSTDQNDYAPTGMANASQVNLNIGASMRITGLAGGYAGRRIVLSNTSTDYLLILENENTSSTAANRFRLPKGFPAFLMPGDNIEFRYDATLSRWRVSSWVSQGSAMGLTSFDEFPNTNPSSSGQALGQSVASFFTGTGAGFSSSGVYSANSTERPVGISSFNTGTTATGRVHVGQLAASSVWGQGPMLAVTRLAIPAASSGTDTFAIQSGFLDSAQTGAAVSGAGWEYRWNGTAEEWSTITVAAGVVTRATTSTPVPDLTYIWLVTFINAAGTRADFYSSKDSVAFVKAPSMSTGLPTAGVGCAWMGMALIKSVGTTAKSAHIDCGGFRIDYVRG